MCETDKNIFISTVRNASDLPAAVRQGAEQVSVIKKVRFDHSFIEVLDSQIRLCSRGPQWARKLQSRRDALAPYCGKPLLKGRIDIDVDAYWIEIDPATASVVYWEQYDGWQEKID